MYHVAQLIPSVTLSVITGMPLLTTAAAEKGAVA
jgi:hypothetical protein